MAFDSVTFWLFFGVAWVVWRCLPFGLAKTLILLLSLLFYAWWNVWYVPLIVASAVTDYIAGAAIHASTEPRRRKAWLLLSLGVNLGLLAVFKYTPFVAQNAGYLADWLGLDFAPDLADWVVPVGISFYTFQTLSYSIDIYRGKLAPADRFSDFFLYVAFFPQLVAGPIVRASELLPQFVARRRLLPQAVQSGLYFIVCGLFLKIVVADNLASAVESAFDPALVEDLSPAAAWLGVIYFSVQIFADFAGYSGIAIGLAYVMGLRFPHNFRYPYISRSLSEFWTRWHISLSAWLRDYLYIPLGGNRRGPARTYLFLLVTMLVGGLWHGAAWTFVAWGGLHGLGLVVERALRGGRSAARRQRQDRPRNGLDLLGRLAQLGLVYVFVLVTWVFFRAPDFATAGAFLGRMFVAPLDVPFGWGDVAQARHLVLVAPVALLHLGQLVHEWYGVRKTVRRRAVLAGLFACLLIIVQRHEAPQFIYFQF